MRNDRSQTSPSPLKYVLTTLLLLSPHAWAGKVVNDVTQLNPVVVEREEAPSTVEGLQDLLRSHRGPVSIGGGRFSMGGQTAAESTLHLDMRRLNRIVRFEPSERTITVEAGITWRKIQEAIDPHGLSVKIMQSYANFTVGGSISVNVHGRYVGLGPLISSVRSIKVVLADGSLIEASPENASEIFYGVAGGYGGLGVIVEATLELAENVRVERVTRKLTVDTYLEYFEKHVRDDIDAVFHNGDIYPPSYSDVMAITWRKTDKPVTVAERLQPPYQGSFKDHAILFGISEIPFGKTLRAKVMDPMQLKKPMIVWRNYEASYDVASLEPPSREKSTYVLQEYFVPVSRFKEFVLKMARIFRESGANVLNVSIRHATKDPGAIMAWAREEVFAFVIYYKQGTSKDAQDNVAGWTRKLIDAAIDAGGTYYLPYQIVGTDEQFHKGYPRAKEFFELKRKLDPTYRFRNRLWERYYAPRAHGAKIRPEENTLLTLPEWYVVYNADDLAEHYGNRGRPSGFSWFAGIAQFWRLYGEVVGRSSIRKDPINYGTHVMIGVVGLSFSIESLAKGVYENTIGRFFEWVAGNNPKSAEDEFLETLAADYGRFIHHSPWYVFPFRRKLSELWNLERVEGSSRLRSWERRFSASFELLVKSLYAWLIGRGTAAAYSP